MALVPKQWYADPKPNERNNYVEILARNPGLFAWLLALIKIDPTFWMSIGHQQIIYQASNFMGYRKVVLPIESVSSSYFGYYKPWKAAAAIVTMFLLIGYAIAGAGSHGFGLIVSLIGVIVAAVYYFLNKELLIGITDNTGKDYSLVLKRAVIGNQEINEAQMELVTKIILTVINNQKDMTTTQLRAVA